MPKQTVPKLLKDLWQRRFFTDERTFAFIKRELSKLGCNPSDQNLQMALSRANFLTQRGSRGHYRYIQKHTFREITLTFDVLPDELMKALGEDFETEIHDLQLNFGQSGTCTAFLLRKILEKLIYLSFAKNGLEDSLLDKKQGGNIVGLKTMLSLAAVHKVHGKPFLMPKTAREIQGIKFLGDTAAHNPLANVSMRTIIQAMPFIVTAYFELSKKL